MKALRREKIWLSLVDIVVVLVKLNAIIAPEELDFQMVVALLAVEVDITHALLVADWELQKRIQTNKNVQ